MNVLLSLPKVVKADARELYDKVETNIRALNSAGVKAADFGAMLIPIVLGKMPNIIRL